MGQGRLYGLDAVRGIAALIVFWHHFATSFGLPFGHVAAGQAVALFFALSGFVMARTYEERLRDGLGPARFLTLRYKRLWGSAAVGSGIGLVWSMSFADPSFLTPLDFAVILLFLPAVWGAHFFLLNPPMWSLFIEIAMNAIHAAGLARVKTRVLPIVMAVCGAAMLLAIASGMPVIPRTADGILPALMRGLFFYIGGIWIYRVYGDTPLKVDPLLVLVVMTGFLFLSPMLPHPAGLVLFMLAFPLFVRGCLHLPKSSWAMAVGAISYPLYAVHVPIIRLVRDAGGGPLLAGICVLLCTAGVTYLFEIRRGLRARPLAATA